MGRDQLRPNGRFQCARSTALRLALVAAIGVAFLAPAAAAGALTLSAPQNTPLNAGLGLQVAPTDPRGFAVLFVDGSPVRSTIVTPGAPVSFTNVRVAPGTHRARVVERAGTGMRFSQPASLLAWPDPAAPRLLGATPPALVVKTTKLAVSAGVGSNQLTALVDGKISWTKAVLPPVTVTVPLTLKSGVRSVELRSSNPIGHASRTISLTRPTWPVPGYYEVGSEFGPRDGRMHKGIDIHAPEGAAVVAAAAGKVIWAKPLTSYGGLIMIDHGGGMTTYYAHLSRIDVKYGQQVKLGQRIGAVGVANVAHLHFQLFVNADNANPDMYRRVNSGTPVDPYPYVVP